MRAENDRFELLAQVGVVADGTPSLDQTVKRLLEIVVPAFADLALLDVSAAASAPRPTTSPTEAATCPCSRPRDR